MAKSKRLSRKQLALIEDLYRSELDEQKILDNHKIGRQLFRKWLTDGQFNDELNHRVDGAYRQSKLLLASNARTVTERLVKLTETENQNPETARKACLDIIAMNPSTGPAGTGSIRDDRTEEPFPIPPETASRLLAVLAERTPRIPE